MTKTKKRVKKSRTPVATIPTKWQIGVTVTLSILVLIIGFGLYTLNTIHQQQTIVANQINNAVNTLHVAEQDRELMQEALREAQLAAMQEQIVYRGNECKKIFQNNVPYIEGAPLSYNELAGAIYFEYSCDWNIVMNESWHHSAKDQNDVDIAELGFANRMKLSSPDESIRIDIPTRRMGLEGSRIRENTRTVEVGGIRMQAKQMIFLDEDGSEKGNTLEVFEYDVDGVTYYFMGAHYPTSPTRPAALQHLLDTFHFTPATIPN